MTPKTIIGTAIALSIVSTASAAFTIEFDSSMSFAGSNLDSIGSGNPNTNFVRSYNAAEGIEIGFKAVTRFGADVANNGNRYAVDPGADSSGTLANWDYVMALDLGSRAISDFQVILSIDFDGAAGVTNIFILDFNDPNVGVSSLSQFADRQNLASPFWVDYFGAPSFDVNTIGDYEIVLSISSQSGDLLAQSRIFADNNVQVVPIPTAAYAGLAMLGSMGAYRRSRK